MICRLSGVVQEVGDGTVILAVGPIAYEIQVPASDLEQHAGLREREVTLHTIQYLEGTPTGSNFTPRIIGFLSEADRLFFQQLVKVKGVSTRKGLRAMSLPARTIAAAIESGDVTLLTGLPEIGKKTAQQIVSDLQGKLGSLALGGASEPVSMPASELTDGQQIALDILVEWGDKRADAQRWVVAVCQEQPELSDPQEIVKAAYRARERGS